MNNLIIFYALFFGIDYYIASFIAGENKNDIWFYFALLSVIPLFFSIKSSIIRIVFWYFFDRKQAIANLINEFVNSKYPKPNWEYDFGTDYLQDVLTNEVIDEGAKISAAKLLGATDVLYSTNQVTTAYMSNNVLVSAIRQYDKIAKDTDD
jgi:hypothetical protein